MKRTLTLMVGASLLFGCADPKEPVIPPQYQDLEGPAAARVADDEFAKALQGLAAHDEAGDWTAANCQQTVDAFVLAAELFARADKTRSKNQSARYNAALAYQRCGMRKQAEVLLSELVEEAPRLHGAQVQLALLRFREGGDLDAAILALERVVQVSEFSDIDALVGLAGLQMRRQRAAGNAKGRNDMAQAKLNLQRALAIDDRHMGALDQLALFYLEKAGSRRAELQVADASAASAADGAAGDNRATLELAALVCSQAIQKDPTHAPIHNTAGLVAARLGDLSGAAKAFGRARMLDPSFFEAHMNYAAVNMQFRGFERAQQAYEAGLKLQPKSYEAILGLSLALRGQASAENASDYLARAEKLLHQARVVDEARPEAYFNEAILVQEFRTRGLPNEKAKAVLLRAKALFSEFLKRAEDDPALKAARFRAEERMRDIDQMIAFL